MRRTLAALAAIILLTTAAACGDDADNDGPDQARTATPDQTGDGNTGDDEAADTSGEDIDPRTDHPVEARPGRWVIGDAGFVEFDRTDGGLVLLDVTESDGWAARVDEDSGEEIEVDFERDNVEIEVEIEWDDGTLEVDINTDIDPAEAGSYEIGQAGTVDFGVSGDGLTLNDLSAADGWELRIDEESSDEIEFTLQSGAERWWVEIELDDGEIELEIDYRVRGSA